MKSESWQRILSPSLASERDGHVFLPLDFVLGPYEVPFWPLVFGLSFLASWPFGLNVWPFFQFVFWPLY